MSTTPRSTARWAGSLLAVSLLSFGLMACSPRERHYEAELAAAAGGRQGRELLEALIAFDQRHPDRLELKVHIGGLLMMAGEPERARAYLERGEELVRRRSDARLITLLHANLAELALRRGAFEECIGQADRALRTGAADTVGVRFTRARAQAALGRADEAIADFQTGRATGGAVMNAEDYTACIRALADRGRLPEALALFRERHGRFGYSPGQGLEESVLYERLERIEEAILSAFMEIELRRYALPLDARTVLDNLRRLEVRLTEENPEYGRRAARPITGLTRYVSGDWAGARDALNGVELPEPQPFLRYLLLSCALEQGQARGALGAYAELEPYFRNFQGYYHHLWRGLKAGREGYSLPTAAGVLEKTILLAPRSPCALETRAELGRLAGLSPEQGASILLVPELEAIFREVAETGRTAVLDPVMTLLALPDTVYGLAATAALAEGLRQPWVRGYLEEKRAEATGRLRERLTGLLGPP